MSKTTGPFNSCLQIVLELEGGYSNHPKDPGGPTFKGVSERVYRDWLRLKGLPLCSVKNMPEDHLEEIYYEQYWVPIRGDELPLGWDLIVFDCAVHSGPVRAIKLLQKTIGAEPIDGFLGARTLQHVYSCNDSPRHLRLYQENRAVFLRKLRTWKHFGRGWTIRLQVIYETAVARTGIDRATSAYKITPRDGPQRALANGSSSKGKGRLGWLNPKTGAVASVLALGETVKESFNQSWVISPWLTLICVIMWAVLVGLVAIWLLQHYSQEE